MAVWDIEFTAKGEECFRNLSATEKIRVGKKLDWLIASFPYITPIALAGEWKGFFKLRIGDIRVIYKPEYQKLMLKVYAIDRRDSVYKR